MRVIQIPIFCFFFTFLISCSKSSEPNETIVGINTPFVEGKINFGIYSQNIELGGFISQIDFSKDDITEQLDSILSNLENDKNPFILINAMSQQDPLLGLAMVLNINQSTLFVKDAQVLAKIKGFGWLMEHYHHSINDIGKIYTESLANNTEILDEDKRLYVEYQPSINNASTNGSTLDINQFSRKVETVKELVEGYVCDISTYTANSWSEGQLYKIVVFSSPLFNKTINFTHPYYLPEESGILRIDVYLMNSNEPTFSMKPKSIESVSVSNADLTIQTASPAYDINDTNWALKSLQILMSGWSLLEY